MGAGSSHPAEDVDVLAEQDATHPWSLILSRSTDGDSITVFEHTRRKGDTPVLSVLVDNALARMKLLRHPAMVKMQWVQVTGKVLSVITDPVRPLGPELARMGGEEIILGLHDIAGALLFLHDSCGLAHNNVCVDAVYLSEADNAWRLGGFEHMQPSTDVTKEYIARANSFMHQSAQCPEDGVAPDANPTHARDVYALCSLVEAVLGASPDAAPALAPLGGLLTRLATGLHAPAPAARPGLAAFLGDPCFRDCLLVQVVDFLRNLTLKPPPEKEAFALALPAHLRALPARAVARVVAPRLLDRVPLGEPQLAGAVDLLLLPAGGGGVIPEAEFREFVLPHILRLLRDRGLQTRTALLRSIHGYAPLFTEQEAAEAAAEVKRGLEDSNDALVEATLGALSAFVPLVGGGLLVAERTRIFTGAAPSSSRPVRHGVGDVGPTGGPAAPATRGPATALGGIRPPDNDPAAAAAAERERKKARREADRAARKKRNEESKARLQAQRLLEATRTVAHQDHGTAETPQEREEDARRSAAGSPAWEDGATGTADTWDGWGEPAEPPVANNAPPGNDQEGEEAGDGSASDWAALSEGEQEEQATAPPPAESPPSAAAPNGARATGRAGGMKLVAKKKPVAKPPQPAATKNAPDAGRGLPPLRPLPGPTASPTEAVHDPIMDMFAAMEPAYKGPAHLDVHTGRVVSAAATTERPAIQAAAPAPSLRLAVAATAVDNAAAEEGDGWGAEEEDGWDSPLAESDSETPPTAQTSSSNTAPVAVHASAAPSVPGPSAAEEQAPEEEEEDGGWGEDGW